MLIILAIVLVFVIVLVAARKRPVVEEEPFDPIAHDREMRKPATTTGTYIPPWSDFAQRSRDQGGPDPVVTLVLTESLSEPTPAPEPVSPSYEPAPTYEAPAHIDQTPSHDHGSSSFDHGSSDGGGSSGGDW